MKSCIEGGAAALLSCLQRGLPLVRRPFADIAEALGIGEDEVISFLARLREEGKVRRFGGVFDSRRMGCRSALVAATVDRPSLDRAASLLTPLSGVTHCYLREPVETSRSTIPNLWFTLSYPADVFPAMVDAVTSRLAEWRVDVLPAVRRFKVDVIFSEQTREEEERTEFSDDRACLAQAQGPWRPTAAERRIRQALQGDTEICADYWANIARKADVREWELLSVLEMWKRAGRLKRVGLVLAHREAGWGVNGMCCWRVDGGSDAVVASGRALASLPEVTHCYERPPTDVFDYNLFAMIHAHGLEEARSMFSAVAAYAGLGGGVMLVSTRQFKKTSMRFF